MEIELITRAAACAAEAHARQKRKQGEQPYINHLIRVAHDAALAQLEPEVIAAGFLHDILEDTTTTRKDLEDRFPPRVVELVQLMTQWWSDHAPQEIKQTEKPKYYGAILRDLDAVHLKLLDRADNLRDMARLLPAVRSWAEKYLRSTEQEITPLFAASTNRQVRNTYISALENLRRALSRPREASALL